MTRDGLDEASLLNRFINVPGNLHDTMTGTDRGLSLGTGAAVAVAALVIIVAVVFFGAAVIGGDGGPADTGNQTTTSPAPGTQSPTENTPKTTTTPQRNLERFKQRFATRLETRHDDIEVIAMAVRNNTVYATTHGPSQGGSAVATADDMGAAFTDVMKSQWENESTDLGIDHAVIQLYNESDYHWFTVRIEESWAYRYYYDEIDLSRLTSNIDFTSHKVEDNTKFLDEATFRQNVSSMDGVEVRSLEQYGGTYFLALEMDDFSGEDYNQTIFEMSEAFYNDRNVMDHTIHLQYVVYAEDGTAVTTNLWDTGLASLWRDGDISEWNYRASLVFDNYDATQIPGGIGSMLTRIQPFPADGPGE